MLRARVLCVPSRRAPDGDAEGLGQVVLEAAAVGTPTVGYRHGGIPEAVRDGVTGLLAAEGDVAGLRAALARALDDDALWAQLSAAARRHVETEFDLGRQTARLEALYDEVCSGRALSATR
jgi:glycosyltransferase involved in cell wall biosynthesis